jgi:hypothetical protein
MNCSDFCPIFHPATGRAVRLTGQTLQGVEGYQSRLVDLARGLLESNVDLLASHTTEAITAIRSLNATIPVVMTASKPLQPTGMKSDKVEMSLLPSFDMGEEQRKDDKPIALGSLDVLPRQDCREHRNSGGRAAADPADADRRRVQVRPDAGHEIPQRQTAQLSSGDKADRRRHADGGLVPTFLGT